MSLNFHSYTFNLEFSRTNIVLNESIDGKLLQLKPTSSTFNDSTIQHYFNWKLSPHICKMEIYFKTCEIHYFYKNLNSDQSATILVKIEILADFLSDIAS